MARTYIEHVHRGPEELRAVAQALHTDEFFATTRVQLTHGDTPRTPLEARQLARGTRLPALTVGAIPLCAEGPRREEQVTLEVAEPTYQAARAAAEQRLTDAEQLYGIGGLPFRPVYGTPTLDTLTGEPVTSFRILQEGDVVADGYPTFDDAREAAISIATTTATIPLRIEAVTTGEGGAPLLTVTPQVEGWTVHTRLEIVGPSPDPGTRTGWLLYRN